MKKLILFLVLLCVAVSTVQAQDVYQWFGGEPANSDWYYGMNWKTEYCELNPLQNGTFGTVPDATAKTKHNNVLWGSVASAIIGGVNGVQAVSIGDIFMVDAGWLTPEDLTVGAGGSLLVQGAIPGTSEGQINIAYAPLGTARLIMDGGVADVKGPVHVGYGGNGEMVLNSGTITVNAVDFGGAGGSGLISITEGVLEVRGYWVAEMIGFADDGLIVAYGGAGEVLVNFDELRELTVVTAIPEPITLSLLSLGALLLRKRS